MQRLAAGLGCLLACGAVAQGQLPALPGTGTGAQPFNPEQFLASASGSGGGLAGALLAAATQSGAPPAAAPAAQGPSAGDYTTLSSVASTALDEVAHAPAPGRAAIVNTVATAAAGERAPLMTLLRAMFPLYNSVPVYNNAVQNAGNLVESFAKGSTSGPDVLSKGKGIVTDLSSVPGNNRVEFPLDALAVLRTLTPLDSSLAAHAAIVGLHELGPGNYSQVVRNLAENWNSLGWAVPEAAYGPQSFATATQFADKMNATAAQYDPTQVAGPFVAGVADAAAGCVAALPALTGGSAARVLATAVTACCPLALKIIDNSRQLDGRSGFINAIIENRHTNAFLKQC